MGVHVVDGIDKPCTARPGNCPLRGEDGKKVPHFEKRSEAQEYINKQNEAKYGTFSSMRKNARKSSNNRGLSGKQKLAVQIAAGGAAIAVVAGGAITFANSTTSTQDCTVTSKQIVVTYNKDSKGHITPKEEYRVGTKECGSLNVDMSPITNGGNFSAQNMYNNLQEGHTYKMTTWGININWAGQYKSIKNVQEVNNSTTPVDTVNR